MTAEDGSNSMETKNLIVKRDSQYFNRVAKVLLM